MKKLILALFLALSLFGCKTERNVKENVVHLKGVVRGSCSGIQVSKYIVSAAHCSGLAKDGIIMVESDGNRPLPRKVLEVSPTFDLMILEGMPGLSGIQLDTHTKNEYEYGNRVKAITHGDALDTYATDGTLIQAKQVLILDHLDHEDCDKPKNKKDVIDLILIKIEVCLLNLNLSTSTVKTVPGSSGGAVVNERNELVGIVSAGDDLGFSYIVTLKDLRTFLAPYLQ